MDKSDAADSKHIYFDPDRWSQVDPGSNDSHAVLYDPGKSYSDIYGEVFNETNVSSSHPDAGALIEFTGRSMKSTNPELPSS